MLLFLAAVILAPGLHAFTSDFHAVSKITIGSTGAITVYTLENDGNWRLDDCDGSRPTMTIAASAPLRKQWLLLLQTAVAMNRKVAMSVNVCPSTAVTDVTLQ